MNEKRYPFSAKRVTVTTVHGYVEADSQSAAADALARNRGVIEIEEVGPVIDQTFTEVNVSNEPLADDE